MKWQEMMYFSRNFVYTQQTAGGSPCQSHCHHPPKSGVQSKISAAKTGNRPQQNPYTSPAKSPQMSPRRLMHFAQSKPAMPADNAVQHKATMGMVLSARAV